MDERLTDDYLAMTYELRRAGIATEIYLGKAKSLGKQLKYVDQWLIPIALIMGEDELAGGLVTLKDMDVGRQLTEELDDREAWLAQRPGQREIARDQLVDEVQKLLRQIDEGVA